MRGHVRERGKGNWYAVLSVRDPATGKRKVQFRSLPECKGKREAQQALARIVTELDAGAFVEPNKTTVAEFLQRWLDHVQTQVQPRTHRGYTEKVVNLIPALGGIPLSKLKPEQISAAYSAALAGGRRDGKPGGLSARSVHHLHRVLKQALGQAMKWGAVSRNVAALVDAPKVARVEMRTLDVNQAAGMIELARGEAIFIPVLLGVLCGLRRGEICALRWRNINLDTGQLSVVASLEEVRGGVREKSPKNGKGRTVALPPLLIAELHRHRLQQAEWLLRWCPADRGPSYMYARGWRNRLARLHRPRLPDFPAPSPSAAGPVPRSPAQPRLASAGQQRAPEDRPGAARPFQHWHHFRHLQPCHAEYAGRRSRHG